MKEAKHHFSARMVMEVSQMAQHSEGPFGRCPRIPQRKSWLVREIENPIDSLLECIVQQE